MAYRPYRGRRRRRGIGLGARLAALAAGTIAVGVTWWLHVPALTWGGAGRADSFAGGAALRGGVRLGGGDHLLQRSVAAQAR